AYIFNQNNSSPAYNVLDYIPADTAIFAAQLEPFPLKDYITSAPKMVAPSDQQNMADLYDATNPGANFILSLLKTYETGLSDADLLIKTFGLPNELRAYFYTLGLLPVFKIELANEQAIWELLDKTELETGFTHQKGNLHGFEYRSYPITDNTDPVKAEMIVAINNGLLTITFNSRYGDEKLLSTALGLTKSDNSLANTTIIEKTIKQYSFKKASLAFINHVEVIKGLTTQDGNLLANHISSISSNSASTSPISEIRTEQCASEFATIAQNWPRTVAGYTDLNISAKESTISGSMIIESKNQPILKALSAIRGFVPNYINDIENNVFATALGLDVNQFANSLNDIWSDLQTPSYSCQPLADIQATISQSGESISMVGMSASMANGVQGISLGLLDYAITDLETSPKLESLDALFTISAENPEQLFNSVKMFLPELQQIQLTTDGEAVDLSNMLPIPSEINVAPKLAIKGKHLVIYNGEKGEKVANALATEALSKNGLYNFSFDFKKMVAPIITATELSGETIPEEAMFLTEYDARMLVSIDVNEQGLIFKSSINNKAPQ
ncbi:MAG: hypothetical protein GY787_27840, partial [Alteromonadales bacterium]|nr:hypothetical protein [Alteromonadales bacterium]